MLGHEDTAFSCQKVKALAIGRVEKRKKGVEMGRGGGEGRKGVARKVRRQEILVNRVFSAKARGTVTDQTVAAQVVVEHASGVDVARVQPGRKLSRL